MSTSAIGRIEPTVSRDDASRDAHRAAARPTDTELVARALAGDRWAEDAIFRRHAPRITALASRLLQRHAEADDVVQDTFVAAFDKLSELRDPTALAPWLNRIAVNLVRRRLRVRTLRALVGLDHGGDDASLQLLAVDGTRPDLQLELQVLDALVKRQPTERRLAFMLHRLQGMSLRETAEASGRSLATVKRYVAAVDCELSRLRASERGDGAPEGAEPGAHPHG